MKVNILFKASILSASILTSAQAGEYVGMLDEEDSPKQSNYHSDENEVGLFLRAGVLASGGTLFDTYTVEDYYYGYYVSGIEDYGVSSKGVELSIGADIARSSERGTRFFGVMKTGTDTLVTNGDDFSAGFTQFGVGFEGYTGGKNVHFIYGTLLSVGSTEDMDYEGNALSYLALEPYIGLEVVNDTGFGGFAKFGYEWRNYEILSGSIGTTYYSDELESFSLSATVGVQYSF